MANGRGEWSPHQVSRARELRRNPSESEKLLWSYLRRDQMGVRFRRQVPVGPYHLDFFAASVSLAVEVDGEQHRPEANSARDDALLREGITTFRIPSLELFDEHRRAEYLEALWNLIQSRKASLSP